MAETALGCAQNADGSLRDASQITFYNDRDDDVPITGPEASSSTQLHPFFTGSAKPLGKVAGSRRRSSRTTRPSARMADPNNAESSVSAGKRKAVTVTTASRKMPRHSTGTASEPEGNNESDEDSDGSAAEADDDSNDEEGEGQEVLDLEQYNSIQTMADADHAHAVAKAPGADSTADVRTVFTRIKGRLNPKTGNPETGAECKICVENGNEKTLLTGSVTSLRYHIARTKGHYQIYKARCDKLGIELNERAIPKTVASQGAQGTLDSVVVSQPRQAPWTPEGLLDYITELVVTQDEAFVFIEQGPFRRTLQFCRPSIKDSDIPTRKTLRTHILAKSEEVERDLCKHFETLPGLVSMSDDAWTSASGIPFININGHYITAPASQPNDWEMRTVELAFMKIEGRHTGQTLGAALVQTIQRYGLEKKTGWITSDGASVNRTTARAIERELAPHDPTWTAEERDMMCMEHAVHTGCKHFVDTVAPTPPKTLHKKIRELLDDAYNKGDIDQADVAKVLATLDGGGDEDPKSDPPGDSEWTAGDAVGKILAFIKQVRMSPQAREFFKSCCIQVGISPLELLLWVRTRWASLYHCLVRALDLRKAIDRFTLIADSSEEVPPLRNRLYSDYRLTLPEWERLDMIRDALREPADVTQTFSKERYPTVSIIIPTFEYLIIRWETMSMHPRYAEISDALKEGAKSFRKWYHRAETTSNAYFICLVLDPNVKDRYFRARWTDEQYKKGMKALEEVFDTYHARIANSAPPVAVTLPINNAAPLRRYGSSYLIDAVNSLQQDDWAKADPRDELKGYLSAPVEQTDNVLFWWGRCVIHPTLRVMARDYLPIQGSSTAAERAFSSGSLTGTKLRNKLTPKIFEALQLLKSAYRNGHISASTDAAKHMDALIADLDAEHFGFPEDVEMMEIDGDEYIM